jgi:hypothetical protein
MRHVSAKHSRKANKAAGPREIPRAPVEPALATATGADVSVSAAPTTTSWLDSSDPRKRLWGKIIFVGLWIYVGALWLLALDQTFNWGIFGPKVPPVP